ncbi:MAG TPA: archease [Candidatus Methanoperedenaceae archaeon]|nr:archease [Candidatus Methanoperedenaceae archaeon]
MRYEYLHHVADTKFRAYGQTIEEAFENAALAMFNAMTDTSKVAQVEMREVALVSGDLEGLLHAWLSELLYLFNVENILFGTFRVGGISRDGDSYSIRSQAWGEVVDPVKNTFFLEVKAVTFHEMEIQKIDKGYMLQVVVDT